MTDEVTNGGYLSADAIFDANDAKVEDVEVPEWGGKIKVRALTKGEHQQARRMSMRKGQIDSDLLEVNLLRLGIAVPQMSQDEVVRLREKNAGVIERVLKAILRVSGLDEDAVQAADAAFQD